MSQNLLDPGTHNQIRLLQRLDDIRIRTEITFNRLALFIPLQSPHLPPLLHLDDLRSSESGRIGHVFAPDTGRACVECNVAETVTHARAEINAV